MHCCWVGPSSTTPCPLTTTRREALRCTAAAQLCRQRRRAVLLLRRHGQDSVLRLCRQGHAGHRRGHGCSLEARPAGRRRRCERCAHNAGCRRPRACRHVTPAPTNEARVLRTCYSPIAKSHRLLLLANRKSGTSGGQSNTSTASSKRLRLRDRAAGADAAARCRPRPRVTRFHVRGIHRRRNVQAWNCMAWHDHRCLINGERQGEWQANALARSPAPVAPSAHADPASEAGMRAPAALPSPLFHSVLACCCRPRLPRHPLAAPCSRKPQAWPSSHRLHRSSAAEQGSEQHAVPQHPRPLRWVGWASALGRGLLVQALTPQAGLAPWSPGQPGILAGRACCVPGKLQLAPSAVAAAAVVRPACLPDSAHCACSTLQGCRWHAGEGGRGASGSREQNGVWGWLFPTRFVWCANRQRPLQAAPVRRSHCVHLARHQGLGGAAAPSSPAAAARSGAHPPQR